MFVPKIPMRSTELVDQRADRVDRVAHGVARPTRVHQPKSTWDQAVKDLFVSFAESGQVDFWQESDWAFAYLVCEDLSEYRKQQREHIRSRKLLEAWVRDASWMKPDEREAAGLARAKPLVTPPVSAVKLQTAYENLARLMVTEADRRRVHVELDEPVVEEQSASVAQMEDYRKRLASA